MTTTNKNRTCEARLSRARFLLHITQFNISSLAPAAPHGLPLTIMRGRRHRSRLHPRVRFGPRPSPPSPISTRRADGAPCTRTSMRPPYRSPPIDGSLTHAPPAPCGSALCVSVHGYDALADSLACMSLMRHPRRRNHSSVFLTVTRPCTASLG